MEKETKAQRVERLKKEKDGLDILDDLLALSDAGGVADADMVDRLKWYGFYTHNQHASPAGKQYFMVRVKIPGGRLTLPQMETLAGISRDFARNTADITVRQAIQFHWIAMENVREIFARLAAVGMTTQNASGDCPRSIVGCPVAGETHDELTDVSDIRCQVDQFFQGNHDFSNLPRKFKIGISACAKHCMGHEIQDMAFTGFRAGDGSVRFDVTVGGGLGSNLRIGSRLGTITKEQIFAVCVACAEIFRDYGKRENRARARVGHLLDDLGLTEFRRMVEEKVGFALQQDDEPEITPYEKRCHFGVEPSRVAGKAHVGFAILSGRLMGERLWHLATLVRQHSADGIALTTSQNGIVLNVPQANVDAVVAALAQADLPTNPSPFRARALACTGLEFCKFAISETKSRLDDVVRALETRFPDFREPITLCLSGCPHSCSHPHVADIGCIGWKVKEDDTLKEGFTLALGGHLQGEEKSVFARKSESKTTSENLAETVAALLDEYAQSGKKSLHHFLALR
ncbi:nitrite/sulfite reductase [Chrysiogenes arsenatis]|uniref:nitrite/sulfite reductase n=1 Tax=Chrysiogenes arsenatis TaxID=309797 RepID=UPI0004149634|nr:nitrite/sulfite reductase [Chrysiogenes arsenatis]